MDSSEIQANREAQAEELEALLAIYGPEQCCVDSETMTLEVGGAIMQFIRKSSQREVGESCLSYIVISIY